MRKYCDEDKLKHAIHAFTNKYGMIGMSITDFNIMLVRNRVDVAPVRCKDCIHRPQWKNRELYPPGYWGDNEADIDWTCPLIDRNELRNSWYMDDDFYCPKGEES